MRPRAIQGVPGLNPGGTPFERLEQFARLIIRVPKTEADKETKKPDSKDRVIGRKQKQRAKVGS